MPGLRDRLRGLAARLRGQRPAEPEQAALPGIGTETQPTHIVNFGQRLRAALARRRTGFQPPAEPSGDDDFEHPGDRGDSFTVQGMTFIHEGDDWYVAGNRQIATPTNFRFAFGTPEEAVSYVGPTKDIGPEYICIRGRDGENGQKGQWSVYYADPVKRAMK